MARNRGPALHRRELGARLRELRLQAGMTLDELAERLLVSPTKISRMETGARAATLRDVRDLVELYGLSQDEHEHLAALAQDSRQRPWWQEYGLAQAMTTFVGLETAAVEIWDYESAVVPALLQTAEYAQAITEETLPYYTGAESVTDTAQAVRQTVSARIIRQEILVGDEAPQFRSIMDEAALHRVIGGPDVMRAQLRELGNRAARPNVTVQVLPFGRGAHPGLDSKFAILGLGKTAPDVVYVEGLIGHFFLDKPKDLARYKRVFDRLRDIALSSRDSIALIDSIADRFSA